jgi:hypothetical protein
LEFSAEPCVEYYIVEEIKEIKEIEEIKEIKMKQ